MDESQGISRRRVMRVGAVIASSAAVVAVVGDAAAADPGVPADGRAAGRGDLGRVAGSTHPMVRVERPDTPHSARVGAAEVVPYIGFPEHVVPRVGDLVTVTDAWPGVALAAIPVCHWVTGVPKALPSGGFQIGDTRVVASPLLKDVIGNRIRACILDTELPTAQVLATRPT